MATVFKGLTAEPITTDTLNTFFASGITGAQLARNPNLSLTVAREMQRQIDVHISTTGSVPSTEPSSGLHFGDTSFLFDFNNAEQVLRQEFVNAEIGRRFGPQNVTSRSSTVNAEGVRTTIPGQASSLTPTPAQFDEISVSFLTPLELIVTGKTANTQTRPPSSVAKPRIPTLVSGSGVQRRRLSGVATSTILTSDADEPIGGKTLLG